MQNVQNGTAALFSVCCGHLEACKALYSVYSSTDNSFKCFIGLETQRLATLWSESLDTKANAYMCLKECVDRWNL